MERLPLFLLVCAVAFGWSRAALLLGQVCKCHSDQFAAGPGVVACERIFSRGFGGFDLWREIPRRDGYRSARLTGASNGRRRGRSILNWPLAHALGGPESIIANGSRVEGHSQYKKKKKKKKKTPKNTRTRRPISKADVYMNFRPRMTDHIGRARSVPGTTEPRATSVRHSPHAGRTLHDRGDPERNYDPK